MIISVFIKAIAECGVRWLFKARKEKASSRVDAISKSADAMKRLLDNFEQQQSVFNGIIKDKDRTILRLESKIKKLQENRR